ncbi:MAG TPA: phosphatidylinositol-specific phospholipase C [Bryobacteraceae bacterium]|nr:phosphatidylinositol-specific phospholipase C [Bryobacteraceae bacterium]
MTTTNRSFTSSKSIAGIAALATVSLIAAARPALAATEPGYSHESYAVVPNVTWMTNLPDSLKLSYMSIPGTHDTMAVWGGDTTQTQSMDLNTQLFAGIRSLDIRLLFEDNVFGLTHGQIVQPGNFDGVMQTVSSFLHSFPGETVLMRIRDEREGFGNTMTFEDAFRTYWSKYSDIFWMNPNNETNPTLGEIRGKVVVLQNFSSSQSAYGLDYISSNSPFHVQDDYTLNSNWDLYNKWTEVLNQLGTANLVGTLCIGTQCTPLDHDNQGKLYVNYLSGSTGVFPYFVASGKSDPSTGGPLLATGKTTPGFSGWPDFPRTSCAGSVCTISFEGTNNLAYNWLTGVQRKRVGIIMADFPGPGLISAIIALNQEAAKNFN